MDIDKTENNHVNIPQDLEVQKLLYSNQKLNEEIYEYMNLIEANKKLISENEKQIWKKCLHNWERDYEVAFDDRIKYYCTKCKLWRNKYMYN